MVNAFSTHILTASDTANQQYLQDIPTTTLAYKKVVKKVRPIPASLPEDFHTICHIPVDPLLSLPSLPPCLPAFTAGTRLTQEHLDDLQLNRYDFLWQEELKLLHYVLCLNELGLA
jgi:hypothetical protein